MADIHERRMKFLLWALLAVMALLIGVQRFQGQSVADGGEFIIVFRAKADLRQRGDSKADRRGLVVAALKRAQAVQDRTARRLEAAGVKFQRRFSTNAITGSGASAEVLLEIAGFPEVEVIHAAPVMDLHAEPGVERIEAPQVWASHTRGEGVTVATIDTGADWNHPAISGNYRGRAGDHTGAWFDPAAICGGTPCDNNSHGTHVVGTIVGANGIGVAPGAEWIACKGCEGSSCTSASLLACGDWVLDPYGDGTGRGAPDVVNNSWGGGTGDPWYRNTVQAWIAAGIVPVFSAGNAGAAGCGSVRSPGDYPEVITIGAFDAATGLIAGFSSLGPSALGGIKPDVTLPGVSVRSSVPGGGYGLKSGTSMAAPHAVGMVALLLAKQPELTVDQVKAQLAKTAEFVPINDPCGGQDWPNNTWGSGIGNALRAVEGIADPPPPANELPEITITKPLDGDMLACEDQSGVYYLRFSYAGSAADPEDGDVSATMEWRAGWGVTYYGAGSNSSWRCPTALSPGDYLITVSAEDSRGAIGSKGVTVNVENPIYAPPEPEPPEQSLPQPTITSASRSGGQVIIRWTDNAIGEGRWEVWESRKGRGWTPYANIAALAPDSVSASVPYSGFARYVIRSGAGATVSLFSEFAQVK